MPVAVGSFWNFLLVESTTDLRLLGGGGINIGLLPFLQLFHA